ncbi:MAG: hypothetical protein PHH85_01700 [Candidatus Methanoperedens sp.]|nr:hypothetical protein [Candidatus Methanoperedens sp.]
MGTISTTIKDIDEPLYRKFRAKIVEKNIKTGDAINQAIRLWLEKQEEIEKPITVKTGFQQSQDLGYVVAEKGENFRRKK